MAAASSEENGLAMLEGFAESRPAPRSGPNIAALGAGAATA
jgi:hypothetical protein